MEDSLKDWGGESLVIGWDAPTDSWIIIAIHHSSGGKAGGGTRMKPYPSLEDAVRDAQLLAEGMSLKFAASRIDWGGAKGVLAIPGPLSPEQRRGLLLRYGQRIKQLQGLFVTGPDVGTTPQDMDIVAQTGKPFVFGRTDMPHNSAYYTAVGVLAAIEAGLPYVFGNNSLRGKRILIQGLGGVGTFLAHSLLEAGAQLTLTDVDPARRAAFDAQPGVQLIEPEAWASAPMDIFVPCALGQILNEETLPTLSCKLIAGAANNQLSHNLIASTLHQNGICYLPDFVANIGGAMAVTGLETQGWTAEQARETVASSVKQNVGRILNEARATGSIPLNIAYRLAYAKLKERRQQFWM